jgi:hypothetical protein
MFEVFIPEVRARTPDISEPAIFSSAQSKPPDLPCDSSLPILCGNAYVETFEAREKYGVPVYVSRSPLLYEYVRDNVASFRDWMLQVSTHSPSIPDL